MRSFLPAVVVLLATFGSGCKRTAPEQKPDGAPPPLDPLPTTPPTFTWRKDAGNDFVLVVDDHPTWTLRTSYLMVGSTQEVRFKEGLWPKNTWIIVGTDERVLAAASGKPFDLTQYVPTVLGPVPVWRRDPKQPGATPEAATISLKTPLRLRLENGVEIATVLPPTSIEYEDAVRHVTSRARKGPFRFDDEGEHVGPHSTFFLDSETSTEVLGPAQTLAEVDWLAVVEKSTETIAKKQCRYVGRVSFPLEIESQTVTIFDRRTHEEVATKTFRPVAACPAIAVDERAISRVRTDDIKAWIQKTAKAGTER